MFTEERIRKILDTLEKEGRVTVNDLSNTFKVTKRTIRNDLNLLASEQLISRCYGGAIYSRKKLQSEMVKNYKNKIETIFKPKNQTNIKNSKGLTMTGKVCVMGSFNVDIVAKVTRFPNKGETLKAIDSTIGPGGKGANQALAASKAGSQVHFISKVGKDQFSEFAFKHLENSDIYSFTLYQSDTQPTGNALIYVTENDGENMIAINPGANQTVTKEEISSIEKHILESDVLVVQLETNIEAIAECLKIAKQHNITTIVNPAPYSRDIEQYIEYIDIITPNETEAFELSNIVISNVETAIKASELIREKGIDKVVITLGSKGVLINDRGNTTYVPAYNAICVDTTGAGDAFNGALAGALSNNYSLINAVNYAAAFASLAVEQEGASAMPEQEQVNLRLAKRSTVSPLAMTD